MRTIWVALICFLCVVFVASLWAVDVAASALRLGADVVNIFGHLDANFVYHLGLVLALTSFFAVVMIAVLFVVPLRRRRRVRR